MNGSIAGFNVSFDDIGIVDFELAFFAFGHLQSCTFHSGRRSRRSHCHCIRCRDVGRDDMVGQHLLQLGGVSFQGIQSAGGQLSECFVVGSEHGERPGAFQRFYQTGHLECLDQRG